MIMKLCKFDIDELYDRIRERCRIKETSTSEQVVNDWVNLIMVNYTDIPFGEVELHHTIDELSETLDGDDMRWVKDYVLDLVDDIPDLDGISELYHETRRNQLTFYFHRS